MRRVRTDPEARRARSTSARIDARRAWVVGAVLVGGCHGVEPGASVTGTSTTGSASGGSTSAASETGDETTGAPLPPPPTACAEATTRTGAPRTIGEAVAFINELPRPLTLDCVLERLERPLAVAATKSVISLQPAVGEHSPRLFLFAGELLMSVAVDGHGVELLEFGEFVGPARTIKAEIEFPLAGPLAEDAPFSRIFDGVDGTHCAICHRGETAAPEYPLAFASDALRFPVLEGVALADLRGEYERCDPDAQPERCARLTALFGHGPVEPAAFAESLPTIYDYE